MTEKDLIELGFERVDENEEPLGPHYFYAYDISGSGSFLTTANVFLKTDKWVVWHTDLDGTMITDLEDLKTMIRILEKYQEQDYRHLIKDRI